MGIGRSGIGQSVIREWGDQSIRDRYIMEGRMIILFFIFPILFILGVLLGIRSYSDSKIFFFGLERNIRKIILNSAMSGLSASFMLFSGVYLYFLLTEKIDPKILQIAPLIKSFGFFLIPGLFIFIGSMWKYFLVGRYRDQLFKWLRSRGDRR